VTSPQEGKVPKKSAKLFTKPTSPSSSRPMLYGKPAKQAQEQGEIARNPAPFLHHAKKTNWYWSNLFISLLYFSS
jgi:hypothetical protein